MLNLILFFGQILGGCGVTSSGPGPEKDKIGEFAKEGALTGNKRGAKSAGDQKSGSREDDLSDAPQEIAGAFLTCARARDGGGNGVSTFGCRVEKDSKIVDLSAYNVSWSLVDADLGVPSDSSERGLSVKTTPDGVWHAEFKIPASLEENFKARADFNFGSGNKKGVLFHSFKKVGYFSKLYQSQSYRLGDNVVSPNLFNSCKPQPTSIEYVGTRFLLQIVVERNATPVQIAFAGICGVRNTQAGIIVTSSKGGTVISKNFVPQGKTLAVTTPNLSPGTYTLEVNSSFGNSGVGRENFLIKDVSVSHGSEDSQVTVLRP